MIASTRLIDIEHVVATALVVLLILAVVGFIGSRRPAYLRGRFLTPNEKRFLAVLDEAVGGGYRVFAQVRLAELVDVDLSATSAKRRAAMNKVFGKSIDFVICDSASLEPVAAIELDDRTHALPHRRERDIFVDAVFSEIGIHCCARERDAPTPLRRSRHCCVRPASLKQPASVFERSR
ncbi:hypothetical protein MSC49_39290 (plasmid) [Methylosinus sp. C49]|uniref:DUF2726 domain-containing protein n=1 Tax=Methylosinus sp. C49 TaxID=2699395 RepID=UPI001366ED1A|nr:DUF2726 domain-containing protein [Methylosinus sp. C49]BBU63994.1 hypothetical protein MSC49_39290 [Methylosinus sp. C49]